MEKKNIVSIEDRIPKLKQARKKKTNRRLIFYLTILFILIAAVVYLQSPLSHVRQVTVSENKHVATKVIKEMSQIPDNQNIWQVDNRKIEQRVEAHPEIKSAEVTRKLPSTVNVQVSEYNRVGYVKDEGNFYPILENGKRLDSYQLNATNGDAPLLIGFTKATYLEEMSKELLQLPKSIAALISEIHWTPTDDNPYQIKLYMNDGFEVQGTIRNFSKKIRAYPSIVAQLGPEDKGIIHIGVGAYFEAYPDTSDKDAEQDKEKEDSENEDQG
ncbi:cell division protein FtsQ/DivIB [Thalassobacillus pellis]|uniref:cell division protein FtsQ/DivIB n=1 Tax=Thalassobacillus pellis TaxID=748008 RepID=UPI0019605C50|nr:cell division protein FtsQ/DivIB [Thalassobacillus pellis]MBM7552849.1 cell division protein FtsQ [Thalassobacillus pellis]